MSRLLWFFAWIVVAIWSLFAWASYGFVDLVGRILVRNSDALSAHPETVEWISWVFGALKDLGLAAIVAIWAIVALATLAVPWLFDRLVGEAPPPRDPRIIDLEPDQYVVDTPRRPAEPAPRGPMPRIGAG